MSSYRLDRVLLLQFSINVSSIATECFLFLFHSLLLAISTCKFCRCCAVQFWANGDTSGRQGQWFLHHDKAQSHTSLIVKQFIVEKNHYCHHPTTILSGSPFECFGCCLLRKCSSRRQVSQPWRTWILIWRPNSLRFQNISSAGVSNNGLIDGASVCVCVCVCVCLCALARVILWSRLGKRCHISYHSLQQRLPENFLTAHFISTYPRHWTNATGIISPHHTFLESDTFDESA
jgi:hypothetical protein